MTTTSLASTDGTEDWPTLEGRRRPEHLSEFGGSDRLGENALTLARRIGSPPMPWQVDNLLALLRTTDDGEWTHPSACIICPRQNGKSEILLLRCLYGLFVRKENILFSTQQWKTARKLAIRFREMVKARPDLRRRLASPPTLSQGQSIVTTTDGVELLFCTRSGDTGKGLDKVDLVIYDEAYNLTEAEMVGPTLAQMAAPHPQTIYTSSAVNQLLHPNGHVLAGIRRNGHREVPGLYFAEYMAPEPPLELPEPERQKLRDDPMTARLANPSHGVIQTDAKVAKMLLDLGGTAVGRRNFEVDVFGWGDWPTEVGTVLSEIPADHWNDLKADIVPQLIGNPAVVLEREGNGPWVITAAWRTRGGPVLVEVGYCEAAPSKTVAQRVVTLHQAWNPAALVVRSGSAAAELIPDLETAGVEVTTINRTEVAQACGGFLNAALSTAQELMHSDQPELNNAVGAAVKKKLPAGGFVWDLIDTASYPALMGASLAHWALTKFAPPPKKTPASPQGGKRRASTTRRDSNVMEMAF